MIGVDLQGDAATQPARYVLKLFIVGSTPNSLRAVANLTELCESHLKNRYELEVIDIYAQPDQAREADIIAAPTLIKYAPGSVRTFVGDLSNKERVIRGLEIEEVA